jgi:hypothetical protein
MRNILPIVCLIAALPLMSCTHSEPPRAAGASQPADRCVVTKPIRSPAPQNTEGRPTDASVASWNSWYVNADRTIWMYDTPMVAGERNKIAWFRPDGADLRVTGRRLDAAAPPLSVDITPRAYRHMFCPSILIFPTEGCWEITGKTDRSELRIVVKVPPKST